MSRKYRVIITRRAERDVEALDSVVRKRIHGALRQLVMEPLGRAKKLTRPELGQYRLRVGDWRIVFDLDGKDVVVLRIGHRREIYRKKK